MKNGIMMQYFEWDLPADGSLWRTLKEKAGRLRKSGVTAVWMPPACKGIDGGRDSGYGVYDLYDLGEFYKQETEEYRDTDIRTKYGTKEEYIEAIKACKQAGIQTYADIVINHMTGAGRTEKVRAVEWRRDSEGEQWYRTNNSEEIEAWTDFKHAGRNKKYSSFVWNKDCFDGVDTDAKKQQAGKKQDKNLIYLFEGKEWDPETNFDFITGSDVDAQNPEVREELKRWGKWYLETTGIDGVRLDAVKHISPAMYNEWLDYMCSIKPLFVVGEYYDVACSELERYLGHITSEKVQMHLFDFALHEKFYLASEQMGYPLRNLLEEDTLMRNRPMNAVTFVDNHDTQVRLDPYSKVEDREVKAWFKPHAYAFILLREQGYPCVFYKDYHGEETTPGTNADKIRLLMKIRQAYAYGPQHDYPDSPDYPVKGNQVGWTREAIEGRSGVAVVMSKDDCEPMRMQVGAGEAGKTYVNVFAPENEIVIGAEGMADFAVALGEVSVYIEKSAYLEITC